MQKSAAIYNTTIPAVFYGGTFCGGVDPRREQYAGEDVAGVEVPNYKTKYEALQNVIKDNYQLFEVDYYGIDNDNYVDGEGFCCGDNNLKTKSITDDSPNYEKLQYYYHPDHLGSASYITNLDGEVVQHIEYVPFGEVFLEERNNTWNTPFLFNGKELDEETGLYYYGARYYNPRISLWYGVDPLAEKYPNISPFAYCVNNPIKYVDPDGEDIVIAGKNDSSITIATDLIDVRVNAGSIIGDLGGNYNLAGKDVLIAALDIVGIVDPTGVADVIAAGLEAESGNYGSAFLSILGVVPLVGDLGKVGKIGKHTKTINKAIEQAENASKAAKMSKLRKTAETGQEAHRQIQKQMKKADPDIGIEVPMKVGKKM